MAYGFSWVVDRRLAGMARPFLWEDDDGSGPLESLRQEGVTALVSLTESPLDQAWLERAGLEYLHVPIPDMQPPEPEQVEAFIRFARTQIASGGAVAVHCGAGLGRTGTMLACYLVATGTSAKEAVAEIRQRRPGSIETKEQEQAVYDYARALKRRRRRA